MAKKHRSPAIHITLQKRKGIDCVGKQSWEVEERGGKESGPFFMLCMQFAGLSGRSDSKISFL